MKNDKHQGKVVTQIRLTEALHKDIKTISDYTGNSLNGTMLHLINLGLMHYNQCPSKKSNN